MFEGLLGLLESVSRGLYSRLEYYSIQIMSVKILSEKQVWFAMRVTYSREMKFKEYLDRENVENFIPMQYVLRTTGERQYRKLVPVIHNIIFVRTTRSRMDEIKNDARLKIPVRYMMDRETRAPLVVSDGQMKSFIAVSGTYDEQLVYLDPTEVKMKKGDKVRIIGGLFSGVEGEFVRVKGDRRVVVVINGVMAVATAFIHPSLIERIER